MKKFLAIAGIVALIAVIPAVALAQQTVPDPQSSHVLIQNLSGNTATVVVEVYNSTTGQKAAEDTFTIDGNGAMTVHSTNGTNVAGHRYLDLPAGFRGSMVVSSDQPVVAVNVNAGGDPFSNHSAYESIDSSYADTNVFIPSVHWRNAQWAMVGIQNTGAVTTTAVYTYYKQNGTVISSGTVDIGPGRSNIRDVASDIDINVVAEGVGAMQVTADQPLGVAAIETLNKRTEAYIGFPTWYGDTTIYLPSTHHAAAQSSHTLVQNMSGVAASLTITYYQQSGALADVFTSTIPANGSLTYHTNGALSDDGRNYEPTHLGNVGSAVIHSDQPLVAVCVETLGATYKKMQPYAYDGFRSDAGATTLLFPSVHANPGGQWSHILIQNLDTANTNQVTLTYYKQDGSVDTVYTYTLGAAGAITFHTDGSLSDDGNAYNPSGGFGNVGSAVITSVDARPLVGVNVETLHGIANVYAGFGQ